MTTKTKTKGPEQGIDKLSPLARYIGKVITKVAAADANKDGKITGLEILTVGQGIAVDSFATFAGFSWPDVLAQGSNLDEQEIKVLAQDFAGTFDISNNEAELIIELWVEHLVQTARLVMKTAKVLRKAA